MVMELARTYEDGLLQTRASVERALAKLSDQALIVVDAPQPFASTVRPFIARATKIVVVTEPTAAGVGVARALLDALERFGVPDARIALVVIDAGGRGTVSRADIERQLQFPVSAELTDDKDRRADALFDGFVTMLAAAPVFKQASEQTEKPVFDRRADPVVEVKP
jgi:Flp pilus assembly CpaE family ATPase